MLSALDLLSVSNLVNYFGRQDQADNVQVSPVLLQKGECGLVVILHSLLLSKVPIMFKHVLIFFFNFIL